MKRGFLSFPDSADRTLGAAAELSTDQIAFLPLERQVRPARPRWLPIGIVLSIISILVIGIVWASVFRIEIVASAKGKIVPTDRAKVIRSYQDGMVDAIHVRNGDQVSKGQPVLSLDHTETAADLKRLKANHRAHRRQLAAVQSALKDLNDNTAAMDKLDHSLSAASTDGVRDLARDIVLASLRQYRGSLTLLNVEMRSLEAEKRRNQFEIESHRARLPLLRERVTNLEDLIDRKAVARPVYLEVVERLVEVEHQLQQAIQVEKRLLANMARLPIKRDQTKATFRHQLLTKLADLKASLTTLTAELTKVEELHRLKVLTAPIDGVVEHLAIYTIGSTVTRGHDLMTIVPTHDLLEIEAHLANKDVGFIAPEQAVNVKLHPFPAARYGSVPGIVADVADDATKTAGDDWAYAVRVRLLADHIDIGDRQLRLSAGMTADLDIVTGDRLLISYLFEPITDVIQSAFRER